MTLPNLPIELINKILILRPTHPSACVMQDLLVRLDRYYDKYYNFSTVDIFLDFPVPFLIHFDDPDYWPDLEYNEAISL